MMKTCIVAKFELIDEHWRPKVVASLNGQEVKFVKFCGVFPWHTHHNEIEMIFAWRGSMINEFRDKTISLDAGEFRVVPRNVEHRTVSVSEAEVIVFEPAATRNTGDIFDFSRLTLEELKVLGTKRSSYQTHESRFVETESNKPALDAFRKDVKPILDKACTQCHGAKAQEGNIRIDSLDPDLLNGKEVDRWLEVMAVVSNGEMPPADGERLSDVERTNLIDWLSIEIQKASIVRRSEKGHTSFRKMIRYEYNHTLQDIFGPPYDFSKDLPPESTSNDGFQNSSELLHMSTNQLEGLCHDDHRRVFHR